MQKKIAMKELQSSCLSKESINRFELNNDSFWSPIDDSQITMENDISSDEKHDILLLSNMRTTQRKFNHSLISKKSKPSKNRRTKKMKKIAKAKKTFTIQSIPSPSSPLLLELDDLEDFTTPFKETAELFNTAEYAFINLDQVHQKLRNILDDLVNPQNNIKAELTTFKFPDIGSSFILSPELYETKKYEILSNLEKYIDSIQSKIDDIKKSIADLQVMQTLTNFWFYNQLPVPHAYEPFLVDPELNELVDENQSNQTNNTTLESSQILDISWSQFIEPNIRDRNINTLQSYI